MKLVPLILLMAFGALLYRGGLAIYESESLELKTFVVEGNSGRRVTDEEIIAAGGVEPGAKLLRIPTAKMVEMITQIPWVADAEVERLLPSKLRITITERRPQMLVMTAQGPYLVDSGGLVLQQGTEDLVQIVDLPLARLKAGEKVTSPEFLNAAKVFRSLPRELRVAISSISAPTVDRTVIRTFGGPSIFYGAAEQVEEKNFAIDSLYANLKSGSVIDVRVPSKPVVRDS